MSWVIDKDYFPDPQARPASNCNAAGLVGPRSYKGNGSELTKRFRLLDDDGVVYYEGRSNSDNGCVVSFGPLVNFGEPNAGCTSIQYWACGKGGGWKTL